MLESSVGSPRRLVLIRSNIAFDTASYTYLSGILALDKTYLPRKVRGTGSGQRLCTLQVCFATTRAQARFARNGAIMKGVFSDSRRRSRLGLMRRR